MLCLNSHKFSTSILARNLVHVLKAVAILTGGYWNSMHQNIKPTWYTDQEFWICLFPIINQNIFSKFSDFRFVISTDYSQNWRFVNEQVLFYLFNVVFSLIFFIIIHYFFLFFFYSFIFGTDEVIPFSAHCPHYGLTVHRAKESWNYFESLNKNS